MASFKVLAAVKAALGSVGVEAHEARLGDTGSVYLWLDASDVDVVKACFTGHGMTAEVRGTTNGVSVLRARGRVPS